MGIDLMRDRIVLTTLFSLGAFKKKGRGTHQFGVGAKGVLRIADEAAWPEHPFLTPGREFPILFRHANLFGDDDLAADYRGAAIKLLGAGGETLLDLLMNTGATTVWAHVAMFRERMLLTMRGKLPEFYERYPDAVDRYYGGLRRAPEGYDSLVYYSKLNTRFTGADGRVRSARFRLEPLPFSGTETGLMTERDRAGGLETARWPEENRPGNHVREAFKGRLGEGPIRYRLQIAVRDAPGDFRDPSYDPTQEWDVSQFSWWDLAELTLTEALPDPETEALEFNIANAPSSLDVFPASSSTEFTSIGHLRRTLNKRSALMRRLRR